LTRASETAPASVLAEVASELVRRGPPPEIVDLLVLRQRPAIDGVLKPFQLGLEMREPRLEPVDSKLRIGLR
jgi:hypothetical protein